MLNHAPARRLARGMAALFLALPPAVQADVFSGRVIGVTDGDTLVLLDSAKQQHSIRLAGIDSPEKLQDFGEKAKSSLAALALEQEATADCQKRDRHRNEICRVSVAGKDLGLEQVRAGMAWWYRPFISEQSAQQRAAYEQAEFMAKARRLGLWSGRNPTPPWDWRRGQLDE